MASEPFKVSDGFYGTGETFLFTFNPEFEVRHLPHFEDWVYIFLNTYVISGSHFYFGCVLENAVVQKHNILLILYIVAAPAGVFATTCRLGVWLRLVAV